MSKNLNSTQKNLIKQFNSVCQTSDATALQWLNTEGWNLDHAMEAYWSRTGGSEAIVLTVSEGAKTMFEKYKKIGLESDQAQDVDAIQGDGLVALINDTGYPLDDVLVLVLFWKCNAKVQFQLQRDEFLKGMAMIKADSIPKLKQAMATWGNELRDSNKAKSLYLFAFEYNKQPNAKIIPVQLAEALWQVLLKDWKRLPDWLRFVNERYAGKAVSKDVWNQLYEFMSTVKTDFSNYDSDGAWPVMIDEFVDKMKK